MTDWELCCNVCVIEGRCRRRHLIGDCEKMKPDDWGQTNSVGVWQGTRTMLVGGWGVEDDMKHMGEKGG